MKTKFFHESFELDISNIDINWQEENTWFKDEFFLSSSFPFELDYSDLPFFRKYRHENLTTSEIVFEGKLQKDGRIEEAILELEEFDDKLKATIRYGVESLPNWDKKLSELELEIVLPEGGDMGAHANTIISKTYPEVNYNFPAIHSKFYADKPLFEDFEGIINKRYAGQFIQNTTVSDIPKNKNIVYPFPYHLYVLNKAVEDAGYLLKGDILDDPDLKDAVIVPGKPISEFEDLPDPIEWEIGETDMTQGGPFINIYAAELELNHRAMFRMLGEIDERTIFLELHLNGDLLYRYTQGMPRNIDLRFRKISNENLLELVAHRVSGGSQIAASFEIRIVHLLDEFGNQIPMLANFSKVQLADKLPDMTVGDFIKFHKRLKNYDFDIRNQNEIWMNLIQNEVEESEAVDLTEMQPPRRKRKVEPAKSYVLQYEGEYDDYYFSKVFIDQNGFVFDDFQTKEDTTEININGIPLPIEEHDGFETAVQIVEDATKLMITSYGKMINNNNLAAALDNLDCKELYLNHWQRWINFIIHAVRFVFEIKAHPNNLMNIKRKSKLFAFNNLMFVFSLNRRRKRDVEDIEIEAYTTRI